MRRFIIKVICLFSITVNLCYGQVTGFLENFNDNVLTGWEVPNSTTYTLAEKDSVLEIAYNRTASSWEWDNFNFTPPQVDVSGNAYISLLAKSDVTTELTLKPIYQNGNNDWLQTWIMGDSAWHAVTLPLEAYDSSPMNRIYLYLDGGSTTPKSGTVYFDDLAIGDSVRTFHIYDYAALEKAISTASALYNSTVEGTEEGQYKIGSKTFLKTAIDKAQSISESDTLIQEIIEQAVWDLYDACATFETNVIAPDYGLVDSQASIKTRYLGANIVQRAQDYLMFGMHDATGYGVGWSGDDDRSDVKDVCGDYPAVYSWDMNKITRNIELDRVIYRITSAFERGGINTLCWHQYDPQGRSFYASDVNNERIVATLLPGGNQHEFYKAKLFQIAKVMKLLRGSDGHSIPIIFRPYHEHDGNWFWWGLGHRTSEEYNALWRFTVTYLRDSLNVHNFIYALSPSMFNSREDYLDPYPGDDMIDIIGMDFYFRYPVSSVERSLFLKRLRVVSQLADETNKVAALTEVGQDGLKTNDWFTNVLLKPLKYDPVASGVAYAAVWRNASKSHHHAPYPGHSSVPDFLDFYNDPYTVFESDLPDMYSKPAADTMPPFFTAQPDSRFVATDMLLTLSFETNERAFIRYSEQNEPYDEMPFEFQYGQGTRVHSTVISVQQGMSYTYYFRAADYYGNSMDTSTAITFTVDTLQAPVFWYDFMYNDSIWASAKAPLGYGSGTDSTEIAQVSTAYFRKYFTLTDSTDALGLLVKCHDGAVAYINGKEIGRVNMPDGKIEENTLALNTLKSSKVFVFDSLALAALKLGTNLVAVEVHVAETSSPDLSFDARLFNQTDIFLDLGSTWFYYDKGGRPVDQTVGEIQSDVVFDRAALPEVLRLYQNYPNPFNPNTNIQYILPKRDYVKLEIFDITGRKIVTLVDREQQAGQHTVVFDAGNFASGIYLYCLKLQDKIKARRMLLLR